MLNNIRKRIQLAAQALAGHTPADAARDVPPLSADESAEARLFFPMEKFFIFGHARSGTTLLTRLVRLHPQVHCDYQAHFFTRKPLLESLVASPDAGEWLARRSNRWNHGRDLSPVVLRAAADFIMERDARREGKTIVGDKSPSSLLDGQAVHLMHKTYPDAHLVYIVRDGRDTAVSHRFQAFIDSPQHLKGEDLAIRAAFIQDPAPFMSGKQSIFTANGIRRAAEGWVRNVTETDAAGKALYGEHYHSLRYEDLLAEPWTEMSRLWAFLTADTSLPGLQETLQAEMTRNPDADWQQEKAGDIAANLQKGKRGNWTELFTERDRQIYHEVAGPVLKNWGYL